MNAGLEGGAASPRSELAAARPPLRFVSAASLFDGHDAAINMIRRLLQARGAEVVHLGHNRSVADIVRAAIDEDADAIAVSSYQGGHNEYFAYMVDMLRERGCGHIRVVVGGGGTIAPQEIEALERHGVEKIYTPEDGRRMGLAGMIEDVLQRIAAAGKPAYELRPLNARDHALIARSISVLEGAGSAGAEAEQIRRAVARSRRKAPVIGITGTGGAGKSSLTDELLGRLARQFPQAQIAVVAMDPTRRRSARALLGDRIRMNSLSAENIFMRSLAPRRPHPPPAAVLNDGPAGLAPRTPLVPGARTRYLAEIAHGGRAARARIEAQAQAARRACGLYESLKALHEAALPAPLEPFAPAALTDAGSDATRRELRTAYNRSLGEIGAEGVAELKAWPARVRSATDATYSYKVRDRMVKGENYTESLSRSAVPKLAVPTFRDWGEVLRFILTENLPGSYPYTGGVYPYRREEEDPTRMFAGEGAPERTNRRFHYLAAGHGAARLSTAFDSTTLYGEDPDTRPDVYGRTGNSGVSIATLDDMKKLYSGFDLCSPSTSVSMTINGPAPMILAMFMNTAIDQQVERYLRAEGRWTGAERRIAALHAEAAARGVAPPVYKGALPPGHDGSGLALLGVTGDELIPREVYERIRAAALEAVRGTVQADILKEDQAQNTCIFSTEFALRMMGDVQQYFIERRVRNFYSVSISGYHIADAGANASSQLAFTLANGFTIVEYYLARGMKIDDFAPNLSFFFSNGMDPEYADIGRVARRLWARAMHHRYQAGPRSQMLKYHVQTSGRSLHAREIP